MSIHMVNIYYCSALLLLLTTGESLRCRSGNEQPNIQVQRIMQTCREKYSANGKSDGYDYATASDNDSSDEQSASSVSLDEELFFTNSNKRSYGNSSKNNGSNSHSSDGNYRENRRNNRRDSYISKRMSNPTDYSSKNIHSTGMSNQNQNRNYRSGMQSQDSESNPDRTKCITQCFFEKLHLVDHGGFPRRDYVTEIMTQGIQDPIVRDFIEESIFECFHYLESDPNNREKCTFSNNLLNCFTDKGRDKCEDWDN